MREDNLLCDQRCVDGRFITLLWGGAEDIERSDGKMKLIEAIRDLASLDDDGVIYASEPWTPSSEVIVADGPDSGLPDEAKRLGLDYFLEVFIARDFLEDWLEDLDA